MYYTKQLMLRALEPEVDIKPLLHMENEVEFRWAIGMHVPGPATRDSVKKYLDGLFAKETNLPTFVICKKPQETPDMLSTSEDLFLKDGKARYPLIGVLHFHNSDGMSFTNRVTGFGVCFDKAHRGKGYGTEVLTWMLEYAFNSMGLHKVKLRVAACNTRAYKCYEKIGFQHEGRLREEYFMNGKWEDSLLMGILRSEWTQRQSI